MGDSHVGLQARSHVPGVEKTDCRLSASPTVLLSLSTSCVKKLALCSEIRRQQLVVVRLKFYASVRMDVRQDRDIKAGR